MPTPPESIARAPRVSGGYDLDVWADAELTEMLERQLQLTPPDQQRETALLHHELGRIALARGDEALGAQQLLRSYQLRPQFRPTLRLARLLYRQRGDYTLVVKLLDAEAHATGDPIARAALLRRRAWLLWTHLGRLDEARSALGEAHRLDATDLATLKQLELMHIIDDDHEHRRAVILQQLDSISDSALRTALLVDLALFSVDTDPVAAIETLRLAARNDPHQLSLMLELELIYQRAGMHRDLAEILVEQSELEQVSPTWAARLLARAARVHRDQLAEPDRAIELFHRSIAVHREYGTAADFFELLLDHERWAEAAQAGAHLFEIEATPRLRAAVACQIGDLFRRLGEPHAARDWYRQCLGWAPSYQPALEGLGTLLQGPDQLEELLGIHRADVAAATTAQQRSDRLFRVAELLERHDCNEDAIAAHRAALAARPGFAPSAAALERLFVRAQRWEELLELYEQELAATDDRERQVYLLDTVASIWNYQLGETDSAIDCYRRLLHLAPDHLPTLRATARLCAEAHRWRELVELNERETSLVADSQRKVELLQRTGEVWENKILDLDRAIVSYRHALAINPEYLPALRALGRLLRQKARWTELAEMHEAEIVVSSDPEQVLSLLSTIAEIYEEELLDEERAADTYRSILQRRPGYAPAVDAMVRILEHRGQWRELIQLLESTLDTLDDAHAKALRLWRIGALREERLGDNKGAIHDYARALRLAPELGPAHAALSQLLEQTGDHQRLIDLLSDSLERAQDPPRRAALSLRLADLLDRTGNPRKAALLFERALAAAPTAWGLWTLAELYQRLGLVRETCETLERLAGVVEDQRIAAESHLRIAQLRHRAGLGDPVPHYRRALSLHSGQHFAVRGIERYLRRSHLSDELAQQLQLRAETIKDPIELACVLTELAELALQRGDATVAENTYRRALEQQPGHLGAIWGLARLLEDQQRWAERAELAESEAAVMESSQGLAAALLQAASLWQERLEDLDRAIPLYRRVLKAQPGHAVAYQRLHRIFTERAEWNELASLIRAQITAVSDTADLAQMFSDLGEIYLHRLGQVTKGTACMRRVLELDAYHVRALGVLGDLHFERGEWAAAEAHYTQLEVVLFEPAERGRVSQRLGEIQLALGRPTEALSSFRRAADQQAIGPVVQRRIAEAAGHAGDLEARATALERLAELTEDPIERIRTRKDVAALCVDHLDQDQRAIQALQQVLVLDPLDLEAIERLAAVFGRTGNRSAVAQHLQASVAHHRAHLGRRPFDARLYRQIGRIFRWQRAFDRLYCACSVLTHLQLVDDVEAQFWREHHARCGSAPRPPLQPGRYERLIVPAEAQGTLRELLRDADPALQRLLATNPSQLGLDRSSRLPDGHPMRQLIAEMAAVLGELEFDIWVSRQPDLIDATVLSRPTLIIGSRVANNPLTAADRFHVGRALFLLAERALSLRNRSVVEIAELLAALGQLAQPECQIAVGEVQSGAVKALSRQLRRKDRRLLGTVLPRHAAALETLDLAAYTHALQEGTYRAGLALCAEPLVALDEAVAISGPTSRELGELMQYVVSEEHFALRVELGLAPGSG